MRAVGRRKSFLLNTVCQALRIQRTLRFDGLTRLRYKLFLFRKQFAITDSAINFFIEVF
jgi:hypothetical protein